MHRVLILSIFLIFSPACATNALNYYINSADSSSATQAVKISQLNIKELISASVDDASHSQNLSVCMLASVNTVIRSNEGATLLDTQPDYYRLTIPLQSKKQILVREFSGIRRGCSGNSAGTGKSQNNGVAIPVAETGSLPLVPAPGPGNASDFTIAPHIQYSLNHYVMPGEAVNRSKRANFFYYIGPAPESNAMDSIIKSKIFIIDRKEPIMAVQQKERPFNRRELLALFYPITVAFDLITSPIQIVFLVIFPPD